LLWHAAQEEKYTEFLCVNFLVKMQTEDQRNGAIIPINIVSYFPQHVKQYHKVQKALLENHDVTFFDTLL
jgi:hypothetical protein